jgi:CRP/FNR family cyclic AMP-dependent transcriptional regulator
MTVQAAAGSFDAFAREGLPAGFIWELSESAAQTLLETARPMSYTAGSVISVPGSPARPGLLVEGRLRIYIQGPDGRQVAVAYVQPGDAVGITRSFVPKLDLTIEALTAAEVFLFSRPVFDRLLESDLRFALAVMRFLARRLESSYSDLRAYAFGDARQRIAQHLLDLAQGEDSSRPVARITQQQLADATGTVREHAARIIKELRRDRLVTTTRGSITILEPLALRGLARGGEAGQS